MRIYNKLFEGAFHKDEKGKEVHLCGQNTEAIYASLNRVITDAIYAEAYVSVAKSYSVKNLFLTDLVGAVISDNGRFYPYIDGEKFLSYLQRDVLPCNMHVGRISLLEILAYEIDRAVTYWAKR